MPPLARLALFFTLILTSVRAVELTVFAAASLSGALGEISPAFTSATDHTLRFNFGASGTLARQIQEGAPADLFVSADELRMDALDQAGLLLPGTRRTLLANTLVVVIAPDTPALSTLADLEARAVRRIALGDPATVPAGTYAKQYLEGQHLWSALEPKFIPVASVRAALAAVEAGNANAAFVYRSDALSSKKVRIALEFPAPKGPRITYPLAVIRDSKHPEAARALAAWLINPEAQAIFGRHGFLPAEPAAPKQ